jgi:hypothetical protein
MPKVEVVTKTEIDLDIKTAAQWFVGLSDEQQADFIIAVAGEAKKWPVNDWAGQFWYVGRHLRDCHCSNEDAREVVRIMAAALAPDHVYAVAGGPNG